MIFVDYLGPAESYQLVREAIAREVAGALRTQPSQVHVRRMVTEDDRGDLELWVELSSEEQLYRVGRQLAERVSTAVRALTSGNVWVMYRVVPLSQAFLNGEPRSRGTASLE